MLDDYTGFWIDRPGFIDLWDLGRDSVWLVSHVDEYVSFGFLTGYINPWIHIPFSEIEQGNLLHDANYEGDGYGHEDCGEMDKAYYTHQVYLDGLRYK